MRQDFLYIINFPNFQITENKNENKTSNYCLEINFDNNGKTYKAGKKYFDKDFILCPIDVDNISIVELSEDIYGRNLSLKMLIKNHSQNFDDTVTLEFDKSFFQGLCYSLTNIINTLNDFLNAGHSILDLDDQKKYFLVKNNFAHEKPYLDAINNLKFEFWQDCSIRIGKDNIFWTDVIITNFPKDEYLKNLILKALKIKKNDEQSITIEIDRDSGFISSHARTEIVEPKKEIKIKDDIKLNVFENYNKDLHRINKLLKSNELNKASH